MMGAIDPRMVPAIPSSPVLPSSSWRRRSCSHCSETIWREVPTGTTMCPGNGTMCRICVAHPSLIQACEVCFDLCRAVPMACTPKPRHWNGTAEVESRPRGLTKATHPVCCGCMASWVSACLDDGRHEVLCPNAECTVCLPDTQLRQHASEQQWESLLDRRRHAGMAQLLRLMGAPGDEAKGFAHWASGKTQACPRCFALVERSGGCNHMHCRCGADFCYLCGESACNRSHGAHELPVLSVISLPDDDIKGDSTLDGHDEDLDLVW